MQIIREGYGSYGQCWVEQEGAYYYVVIMNGASRKGPYTHLMDALQEFSRYCS